MVTGSGHCPLSTSDESCPATGGIQLLEEKRELKRCSSLRKNSAECASCRSDSRAGRGYLAQYHPELQRTLTHKVTNPPKRGMKRRFFSGGGVMAGPPPECDTNREVPTMRFGHPTRRSIHPPGEFRIPPFSRNDGASLTRLMAQWPRSGFLRSPGVAESQRRLPQVRDP